MTMTNLTDEGKSMVKVTPQQKQIAREANDFILVVKIDASTRHKEETDSTFELSGPLSFERREILMNLFNEWFFNK
jgi:hypothetical protein